MKKKSVKKLDLHRESIRRLDLEDTKSALGGATSNCDSENSMSGLCRSISCLC